MDEKRFDAAIRTLGAPRRVAVQSAGAAVLGLLAALGLSGAAADKAGKAGNAGQGGKNRKKRNKNRNRNRNSSTSTSVSEGTPSPDEESPTGQTGAGDEVELESGSLIQAEKKAKAGPTGPTGPTGPAGPAGPLDILTDVNAALPTQDNGDGAVLVYNSSSDRWEAHHIARFDRILMTTNNNRLAIQRETVSPPAQAQLDLSLLLAGNTPVFKFPAIGGTFALTEQLVFNKVTGTAITLGTSETGTATATCATGSNAIAAGIDATNPVNVQSMITSGDTATVTAQGISELTNVSAVAFCMAIP